MQGPQDWRLCVCVCMRARVCVKDLLCAIKEKQPREQGKDKTVYN